MYNLLVLSFLGVFGVSVGQILQNGQCDNNIPLVENFQIENFLGTWNEIARTDTPVGGDCSTIEFTRAGQNITVFHKTVRENFYSEYRGLASAPVNSSRLTLSLPTLSNNPIDFWVLSTDYNNFALTYGCENVGNTQRRVYLWQIGRATSFPNVLIPINLDTLMNRLFNITNDDLRNVGHNENACFELPIIEAGRPVILPGQCNVNITGVANFQPTRFLGVWHQIQSYYSDNASGACNRAQYSDGGDRVLVVNSQIINRTLFTIEGYANVISNDSSGQLGVVLEVLPGVMADSELLILGTDYDQWAVSYTCNNLPNNTKQVYSWVVSRTRQLPAAAREQVNQVINSLVELNNVYYSTTNQSDASCFYIPEVVSGEPIVFGGQCDLSIPVVSNFSAVDYMGLWHEIERYPTPFQFGACNNAFYSLGAGGVDVFNTQVLNETLLTINGLAVPVDDGKLVVSFPVEGTNLTTETDYWVLSTNYSSHSLVYSCRNINDYQQQVTFWKLSRTKQLTVEAQAEINSIINSLDILNQTYFTPTDQSPQGCFYYPEPQPGTPVEFPGSCEANISVVPNFNATLFQGPWFEVEAYPKNPQEGQCVNHQFSTGSGSAALNFVSSSVDNQLLTSTNGQLTFYANETGGRLTLSFVSNGTTISFPYYVIATDYTDYALVYSCLNISADFRGIWAWKLSRTRQLTNNANTQINNALNSSSVVLSNDYFEPVDQSDYACFYFPNLAPGAPVVVPGQCDLNLPVIQNFNASRYLGRWHLIESYPALYQIGQCNQATYSLRDDGIILVYNNEVVNQTLNEDTGLATLIGNGTEGKFNVTFPSVSQTVELWVLDTDYDSYSIAYSCINENNQTRRIQSWKLSRTTSLTPAAVAAINNVTSNVDVLNDRYYLTMNHSDAACFYYPTPGSGPNIFRGQCDENIPVVTGFDAVGYMGLWHDIESYAVPFQDGSCPNAFYTLNTELGQVEVFNTQVFNNETLDTISGYATLVPSNDSSAKLLVTFPTVSPNSSTPYWVLSTDYTSYALVYSCVNLNDEQRSVSSWKLSRTKSLNQTAAATINRIVDTIPVLDERYYNVRDQTPGGCFYYPEPQPGVPVRFPGQCETNITVVNNFNISRFSGIWHEIEAYPKEEQTGDCINHEFSVSSNNSLGLLSYNVIAQSLGVTDGVVEFAGNNTEARLTIRFTSNGTVIEIPYWIIDTDYDNYALAYSCVNINDDFRGVWSWKLSRTKQLSAVDNATITNAIANITVLGNQYYENINQSDEACFFYPAIAPGETVVFPGQCANISAMPNFNASAYLGVWRTIESYPSEFQLGTCGDATYSLGEGVVIVYNTEVVNASLSTIYGTAVAAADGTGRLYVTFPNSPYVAEYLVLDTDYTTYALVYSCFNNNNTNERTVYSWKLSRTNNLTQSAVAAINATVNRIDVLSDRYYQIEDRSPSGCFYLPEPNNSTVMFRGQCNLNISVQPSFDAVAYTGIWYSIESYPAPFQDGTCGTASYRLDNATGVVLVENTQVLDQVLDVQTGIAVVVDNAKLAVTFEVNGVNITTDYWILATDYLTYSLVYSCQNINAEWMQVNSWKLSRNQSLTPTAVQSINNVINTVQVLDQRYFVPEGQSENDCFFYPDNQGGDVVLNGQCVPGNQVPAITNFNSTSFAGIWHEVARFPSDLQEGECTAANFSLGAQNSLNITQTIVDDESQSINIIPGAVSADGRGVISATVGGVPFDALYILDTNYQEYALIYACRELSNNTKQIYSWKLARSRAGFSPAANTTINQVVSNNTDLFEGYYSYTEQTSDACFHYPDSEDLEAVELEGSCPNTIRGVPNFNATAYLGLWREIEKYPQANQFGTCDRAFYSPGDGNVLVMNTQVVGNSLLEQLGTAEVASTDGTGLLSVNFNVNGVEVNANYYILATDYSSYALVYSCRNTTDSLGHAKRLVSSWKLSRTNSLSAQAQAAINLVVNQTQGLSQGLYQATSQSDEDCFYIPEPNPNSAPLFRRRCGTVNGVANFNASRFEGWWHELERYPVDSNIGECISSRYSVSGNGFQVVDTAVANGSAAVITGTVTVSNGVLTRVLNNGVTEEIVVLDTDYDNYALLYSCVDVTVNGEEYRRVWSAKHSKSRTLSSVNVASLNATIESNEVLYQQFYQTVSQSDQSCFHYPEVQGQRVILPGQCDLNIPVVANFDVAAYGGTWYQIEKYPQVHEDPSSTCIGARYVLDADAGVVNVLNWEVIDGTLETIEGTATVNSTDGSAQLAVVLPIVGTNQTVTTSLYVLATDYEGYSLAYSCSNINAYERSIGAWKLSRDRTMSSAGNTVINDVIARREELDSRYFRSVDHSGECPEPSSSAIVKSSILVMLVCALIQFLY